MRKIFMTVEYNDNTWYVDNNGNQWEIQGNKDSGYDVVFHDPLDGGDVFYQSKDFEACLIYILDSSL